MKRCWQYSLLVLVFAVVLVSCNGSSTYYVDGSYGGTEAGTKSQPFRSIVKALSKAAAGDTVEVAPGLYRENVLLKPGVKLISRQTGAAIIHGGAERGGGQPAVSGADKAELVGFTVTGGYDGIKCVGTSPVIKRNIIRGNYGDGGIVCLDGSKAVIENNTILGNLGGPYHGIAVGIYVEKAAPTVRSNIVTANSIGYAPYRCSPVESYNNIWGNRQNFGYSAAAGTGTISRDPLFAAPWLDDYRLKANSPCRDAGDPSPAGNDADGSRSDMGAFDGNGGYGVSLPVQEFFLESVLDARDEKSGLKTNGTSRFTADPVFWFPPAERGKGEQDVRPFISTVVAKLTANRHRAVFRQDLQPPVDLCSVITVTFVNPPHGFPLYKGLKSPVCRGDVSLYQQLEESGAAIVGGELQLSTYKQGFSGDRALELLYHELEHVASLDHSYRGDNVMNRSGSTKDYSPQEKEAFELLYKYPVGTKLDTLIQNGEISRTALYPFPRVDGVDRWDGQNWRSTWNSQSADYWARPGDYILLKGSRLTLRFKREYDWSGRPADYTEPTVHFGSLKVSADVSESFQAKTAPKNTYVNSPACYLKVEVPKTLKTSGWVFIESRGLVSNPVYLTIK